MSDPKKLTVTTTEGDRIEQHAFDIKGNQERALPEIQRAAAQLGATLSDRIP